jgi:hypothetical protein
MPVVGKATCFYSFFIIEINVVYRADIISMGDGKQG